jgi:lipoprotein-releasing system ATP-binding protein
MSELALKVQGLSKSFEMGGTTLPVLRGIDLEVGIGERVAIVGQSGSGKSTFLHVVGTLDTPTEGQVFLEGVDAFARDAVELDRLRNRHLGFVFQFHHLLPDQDAVHNVMIPAMIGGTPPIEARGRAEALLERVGLADRMVHRPGELSGGEQQRVALARALVQGPRLLLADEPTGNLDPATAAGMLDLMLELNGEQDTTLIVVTHSVALASRFPRQLSLERGRFVEQPCA